MFPHFSYCVYSKEKSSKANPSKRTLDSILTAENMRLLKLISLKHEIMKLKDLCAVPLRIGEQETSGLEVLYVVCNRYGERTTQEVCLGLTLSPVQ